MTAPTLVTVPPDPATGRVSPLATALHVAVLVLGAVVAVLSVTKTGVGGPDASVGTASGSLVVLGALWKYLDSHDKAVATFVSREVAWGQAHAPQLEAALSDAKAVVAALPTGLQERLTTVEAQAAEAVSKAGTSAGIDVDAIAEAAKAKVVAALTAAPPAGTDAGPGTPRV